METQPHDDSSPPAAAPVVSSNNAAAADNDVVVAADASNHKDAEPKFHVPREQVTQILQAIASTAKFTHDWDDLKSILSFQLKQVLSEYPEAKMTSEEQYTSLGESYSELVNKLDEELTCFIDGPPFTLQRLCEILLDARNIYPNLSKLALALEKNLLVTSTLTISTGPYPQATVQRTDDHEKASEKQEHQSDSAQNGIEPSVAADKDEVMAEADTGGDNDVKVMAEADTGGDNDMKVMAEADTGGDNDMKVMAEADTRGDNDMKVVAEADTRGDNDMKVVAEADTRGDNDMTVDMEAFEDAKSSETNSEPNSVTNAETNSNSA